MQEILGCACIIRDQGVLYFLVKFPSSSPMEKVSTAVLVDAVAVTLTVEETVALTEDTADGIELGTAEGTADGVELGVGEGIADGTFDGMELGDAEGIPCTLR